MDSSSGFENGHQGNTWRSPWTLWDAIPWPRSHLAEVTSSTLGGPREQQEGPVPGPSAKLARFLYTPVKKYGDSDALSLPVLLRTEVLGDGVARPALPSSLMNERSHWTWGLRHTGVGQGCWAILENWGLSSLSFTEAAGAREAYWGRQLRTGLLLPHGDAAAFLLQQEPAQEMQRHWMRAWNGVRG